MIHNLNLRNFKKHSDLDLEFTEGLNGIFGPNYTGKTTILYGILYALGGASHIPGTNIQKVGTNTGLHAIMEFDVAGDVYRVERKKSGAYLYAIDREADDEQMIASGTSNVTSKIEELLGMSIKRFRQLKYAEQKKAHALLTLGATELHKIIEELTGIDQINVALEKLKDIVSSSAGAMEALSYEDPSSEEEKETDLVVVISDLIDAIDGTKKRLAEEVALYGKLCTKQSEFSKQKANYLDWKTQNASLTSALSVYQLQVDSLKESYNPPDDDEVVAGQELEEKSKEAAGKVVLLRERLGELRILKSSQERLSDQVTKTRKVITTCADDYAQFDSDLAEKEDRAKKRMMTMADKLTGLQSEFTNKKKLFKESKCPVCQREYEGKDRIDEKELVDLEAKVDATERSYRDDREAHRDLVRLVGLKGQAEEDLARNNAALQELLVELDEVEQELGVYAVDGLNRVEEQLSFHEEELEEDRTSLAGYKAHFERQATIGKDLEKAEFCLAQCKADIAELVEPKFDNDAMETNDKVLKSCYETKKALSDKLVEQEHLIELNDSKLDRCREDIARMLENNKSYEVAKKRNGTAKALQKYLRENRDRYSRETWDFFLGSASTFVSDCTNATITEIQRTENGQFQFVEGEERVMGLKDASGAQEAIMGLSVQLALAQAAQCPLDILLVDEPTADMDAEHSMAVAAMLSTKGNQVIAISHREMDASLCNNVINMENIK